MQAKQQLKVSLKEIDDLKAALDEHVIVAITGPQGKITFVSGKPHQYVAIRADITERKLPELASMRLAAKVESPADAIIDKTSDGIITSWNRGAEKIFGCLPRLARNAGSKSAQPALPVMYGGNETILLAEDDPSLRASLRITLTRFGYRVLEAPTGVKAMEVWKEHRDEIRLLLTDIVMSGEMTGAALAQGILQENPKLKMIYMSGYSAEVASKGFPLKEGVNFLTKPFPAARLAQTIRELLDAKI